MLNEALMLERRGYNPQYRTGTACPGCSKGNWIIGRFSAECAYCGTSLSFAPIERAPGPAPRAPAWADRP